MNFDTYSRDIFAGITIFHERSLGTSAMKSNIQRVFITIFIIVQTVRGGTLQRKWVSASVNLTELTKNDTIRSENYNTGSKMHCLALGLQLQWPKLVCYEISEPKVCSLYDEDAIIVGKVLRDDTMGHSTCKVPSADEGKNTPLSRCKVWRKSCYRYKVFQLVWMDIRTHEYIILLRNLIFREYGIYHHKTLRVRSQTSVC